MILHDASMLRDVPYDTFVLIYRSVIVIPSPSHEVTPGLSEDLPEQGPLPTRCFITPREDSRRLALPPIYT